MSEKIQLYSLIVDNKDNDSNPSNEFDNLTEGAEVINHYDLLKSCSEEPAKIYQDGRSRRPRSFAASGNHKLEVTRFIEENSGGDECTKKMIILRNEQRGNLSRKRISLVEEKLLAVTESSSTTNLNTLVPMSYNSPAHSYNPDMTAPSILQKRTMRRTYITLAVAVLIGGGIGGGFALCLLLKGSSVEPTTTTTPKVSTTVTTASVIATLSDPELCPDDCAHDVERANLTHGKITCAKNLVTVKCAPGFKPEKSNFSCSEIHKSLPKVRCTEEVCPIPKDPMHGRVTCQSNHHTVASTCTVDCTHGALHEETAVIRCQKDFTWTELPTCKPPPCSPQNNNTGKVSCTSSGRKCIKNCGQGRLSRMTTCQEDGIWDYNLKHLSCEPACELEAKHGFVRCEAEDDMNLFRSVGVPHSSECSLMCNAGFHLVGSGSLVCSRQGQWSSGECEGSVLVLAGGEIASGLVEDVEVHAESRMYSQQYSNCLPNLPQKLRWGNMGLVEDSLMVCGGQNEMQETGTTICWIISPESGKWQKHSIRLKR